MDVATATDTASEAVIVGRIRDEFPHDSILAEEGSAAAGTTGRRWIIDPLDGTINFVHNHGPSSVSIGVEVDGQLAVGAVYDPFHDEMFTGAAGLGAFRNGQPLPIRLDSIAIDNALIGVLGGYHPAPRRVRAEVARSLILGAGDIRYAGSAALDFCYVADGRLHAGFANGLSLWDMAAGTVIAREAGCIVEGPMQGTEPTPECLLIAVPAVMAEFRSLVQSALTATAAHQASVSRI
jgi:myo-inositol-1(or 4)-monophosphatase